MKKKVLLIEPDAVLGSVCKKALQAGGHTVMLCRNAQEAMHQVDEDTPDVVVMEMQLPRHSGVEFLYEFRSYAEWQRIPIILYTFVPKEVVSFLPELHVTDYLYKPKTTLAHLKRAITRATPVAA